jgi:hypothetical protein
MALSHRTVISWSDGANAITGTITNVPGLSIMVQETIPPSSTNLLVTCAIDNSTVQEIVMLASGGAMTLKTNSSGSPAATINLVDGVPLIWNSTGGYSSLANSPIGTTDVTVIYVTSTPGGTLYIGVGCDATP